MARPENVCSGQTDDLVVELTPGVVLRLDVHGVIVVEEVEREWKHAIGALVLEVQRRCSPERGEKRITGERTGSHVHEAFRQFERLRSFVRVEPEHEVGLDAGDILRDQVDVLGDLADFVHSGELAGPGLVAELVPGFDAGQQDLESAALEPLQMRLCQEGKAALRDEIDPVRRHRRVDRVQGFVESHAEVRVVPADARPLERPREEPEVIGEHREVEGLIRDDRIDAKAAGVGTPEAGEHRHDLEKGGFLQRRLDELPTLAHAGERRGLPLRRKVRTDAAGAASNPAAPRGSRSGR